MKKQITQVQSFHEAFGQTVNNKPTLLSEEDNKLRTKLMQEELNEYTKACEEGDIVEIADALGDKLYILCGTMVSHGLQDRIEAIFDEIHRSNMTKLGPDGKPIYREDGKVIKPEGWTRPDIKKFL